MTTPKPPKELGPTGRRFWRDVLDAYALDDPAGLKLLTVACAALDRMWQAREEISKHGLLVTVTTGDGEVLRANPACKIELDSRNGFLHSVRMLNLDIEPLRDTLARGGPSPFQPRDARSSAVGSRGSVTTFARR
jgi:phage terminase small subunit